LIGSQETSLNFNPTFLAGLSYLFGCFSGGIIFFLEKKNVFVIFHAFQSLLCGLIAFCLQLLFVWNSFMYRLLWIIYIAFIFVMIYIATKDAAKQTLFKIPFIGDIAENRARQKVQSGNDPLFYRFV